MAPSSTSTLFRVWSDEYFSHNSPQIISETQWLTPTSNWSWNQLFILFSKCTWMWVYIFIMYLHTHKPTHEFTLCAHENYDVNGVQAVYTEGVKYSNMEWGRTERVTEPSFLSLPPLEAGRFYLHCPPVPLHKLPPSKWNLLSSWIDYPCLKYHNPPNDLVLIAFPSATQNWFILQTFWHVRWMQITP